MIHNTLKTPEPLGRSPRSTHSPAQRRLWRYSVGCRGSPSSSSTSSPSSNHTSTTVLTQTHRRSVCVLAADLGGGGGGGGGGEGVLHTIHGLCHLCIGCRLPQVNILRGKDGYGFTICSDSPVRVQGVDPGGPADQAGLQHLDTLLQLNGQPVEQWKCIDLAHAIRNSSNEIRVVVWRTGPSAKPSFEGLVHRPAYKPSTSNYDAPSPPTRRRMGVPSKTPPAVPPLPAHHRPTPAPGTTRRLLLNGSELGGGGGPGWGGRVGSAEELDGGHPRAQHQHQQHQQQQQQQQQQQHHLLHHPHATATLKGTRVKASNGDNYIILAPINAGSQVPQSAAGELHLHHHHLLHHHPPPPHHPHPPRGRVVAHPRYVSLPYLPDATS